MFLTISPYKLVISGESVGGDNRIEYPTLYFLDGDQDIYFDDEREAKNGVVKVDGFEFEISDEIVSVKEYASIPVNLHPTYSDGEFNRTLFLTTGSDAFLSYFLYQVSQ